MTPTHPLSPWSALGAAVLLALGPMAAPRAGELFPAADPAPSPSVLEPRTPLSEATTPGTAAAAHLISAPGSYYLTGNLQVSDERAGIAIATGGVTLDLMGFQLLGGGTSLSAIAVSGDSISNVIIRNGTIRDWGGDGIGAAAASGGIIEGVNVTECGGAGIVTGDGFLLADCTAQGNSLEGFSLGEGSAATRCRAISNLGRGFALGPSATARLCIAVENLRGFELSENGQLSQCIALENSSSGIQAGDGCMVMDCTSSMNASTAIGVLGSGGVVTRNLALGRGAESTQPALVVGTMTQGNSVEDNTISNGGSGGLSLGGSHSLAVRNFSSDNLGSDFIFGNDTTRGEVLDFSSTGAGVIDEVVSNHWNNVRH